MNWKESMPGQAEVISQEPIAIYNISEVPISKWQSQFQVQITTEIGSWMLPRRFRTMGAAQRACKDHLWRRKIAHD
jgi:hypothetical protein